MENRHETLIDEMSKNLRKSRNEVEKSIHKLIKLKLIDEVNQEEFNENNKNNSRQ